jgi:hypothetical protein
VIQVTELRDAQSIRSRQNQSIHFSYIFNFWQKMKQKVFESEVIGPIRQNHSQLLRNIRPGRDGTTCHKRKYEPQPSPLKLMLMLFSCTMVTTGQKI